MISADRIMVNDALMLKGHGSSCAILYQDGSEETLNISTAEYLEEKCLAHGSTMEGRQKCFAIRMQARQKLPVLVSETSNEIWFPLTSMKDPDVIWLNHSMILEAKAMPDNNCCILFASGISRTIRCSARTVKKQMKRCHAYLQGFNENG